MNTLELLELRDELKGQIADLRDKIKEISDLLEAQYLDEAKAFLAEKGQDFGTAAVDYWVRLAEQDTFQYHSSRHDCASVRPDCIYNVCREVSGQGI